MVSGHSLTIYRVEKSGAEEGCLHSGPLYVSLDSNSRLDYDKEMLLRGAAEQHRPAGRSCGPG